MNLLPTIRKGGTRPPSFAKATDGRPDGLLDARQGKPVRRTGSTHINCLLPSGEGPASHRHGDGWCPQSGVWRARRARPEAALHLIALLFGLVFLSGCQSKLPDPMNDPLVARFFLEARPGEAGLPVQLPISKLGLTVNPKPVFVETDIIDADLIRVKLGWCMMIRFTPAASRDLYRLTAGNQGRRLVLAFNDQPAGARRIDEVMTQGGLLIFVEVDDVNLPPLVERLKRTSADLMKRQMR